MDINNLSDLIKTVQDRQEKCSSDKGSEHLWYRGHGVESWDLIPGIQRFDSSRNLERPLTNEFYIRASRVLKGAPTRDDYVFWLPIMQHYGIPTRLLDWSESPLVAAFFATTVAYENEDGCIWILRPGALNRMQGSDCLYPLDSHTIKGMLQGALVEGEPEFVKHRSILACYSVGDDVRMYAQQSCFTVHRNRSLRLDADGMGEIAFKIRIPATAKALIRYQLALLGITEKFMFPDLEHVASDVRHMYGIQ